MKGGGQETGEQLSLPWECQGGLPCGERPWQVLQDGRAIRVMFWAKGTASTRDSEADKSLVWLGDKKQGLRGSEGEQ